MALIYNGSQIDSLIYNGNETVGVWNGSVVWEPYAPVDPYNPLDLPANTIRCKLENGYNAYSMGDTQTLVDSTNNVWDIYKQSNDWSYLLNGKHISEVLGANTTNVMSMRYLLASNNSLTTVPLFDTSNVTDMYSMFDNCGQLTSIPLYDTTKVTNMTYMFYGCTKVQSGALALYQQASSQTTPPTAHQSTFRNCGKDTDTGAAELAQIPDDWK